MVFPLNTSLCCSNPLVRELLVREILDLFMQTHNWTWFMCGLPMTETTAVNAGHAPRNDL